MLDLVSNTFIQEQLGAYEFISLAAAEQNKNKTANSMASSDMHEWYIKNKCVYIGNPNQTRHLGDHHRRIEVLELGPTYSTQSPHG